MTTILRRSAFALIFAPILLIVLTGCQLNNPPQPTLIPTEGVTLTGTTAPEPTASLGPTITLRPVIEPTQAPPTAGPVVELPTQVPTPGAYCRLAKANDTVCGMIFEAAYPVCSPALSDAFRAANNMSAGSTNIQPGQQYCVPRATPTITPTGYDLTETLQATQFKNIGGPGIIATYVVKSTDNITTIELNTGVPLRILCEMNGPTPLNCAGCDLDKPVNEHGCHPTVVVGESLKIPGPTATPSITPTLTGSETATPTPPYGAPRIVSPINGAAVSGGVQLVWLPVGTILQADQFYLVLITDSTANKTWEYESGATSLRLPTDIQPTDGSQHTFNWRVVVATKAADGSYVVIGEKSLISTFTWKAG